SANWPVVYGHLENDSGEWRVIQNGQSSAEARALGLYLKSNITEDAYARVASGEVSLLPSTSESNDPESISLPPDIQQLARERGVNSRQADRLVERMTGQVFGRLNRRTGGEAGALRDEARSLLKGSGPDWETKAGQRLKALAALLTLPADWR